ncbi:MAG: hypothetical protein A2173_07125 [Planctomycetes bacterium RBG_13_44_8b]|nr:MAG: hypothetical protein A2173_07125 [Planctomycetes bacterium RBG_13_44_8b]
MIRKKVQEEGYNTPLWIITFSDMTTNLLTFFVLLLSMGHMRDSSLFDLGQAPIFLESVKEGFGIKKNLDIANVKIKYNVPKPGDPNETRTIDAKGEEVRRLFTQLASYTVSLPSQIQAEHTNFWPTNVRFTPGSTVLDDNAKNFLKEFSLNLQERTSIEKITLYVLGIDNDEQTEQQQLILSAIRARIVADYLKNTLPAELYLPIFSWGAGSGGQWIEKDSPISGQSHIYIAVLQGK